MHLYQTRPRFPWKGLVITLAAFAAVIWLFVSLLARTGETADREQETLLKNAITAAAVSAYAIEGKFPATIEEIQREYGVVIDSERFVVFYDRGGMGNRMPMIRVINLAPQRGENE